MLTLVSRGFCELSYIMCDLSDSEGELLTLVSQEFCELVSTGPRFFCSLRNTPKSKRSPDILFIDDDDDGDELGRGSKGLLRVTIMMMMMMIILMMVRTRMK